MAQAQTALAMRRAPDTLAVLSEALAKRFGPAEQLPAAPNAYLTIRQAAHYIGRTVSYIERVIKDKSLPAVKDRGWRIRKADLEKL